MSSPAAVVTIVHGRHEHLAGQFWGLARQERQPEIYVAVAMDDPEVAEVVTEHADPAWDTHVVTLGRVPEGLPLAAARNAGASVALRAGAETLVFLDVDCIPSPSLVGRYAEVLAPDSTSRVSVAGPVVAGAEVRYLPPSRHPRDYDLQDLASLGKAHPARPVLDPREVRVAEDLALFWSLSFAVTAADWERLGGFCEDYVGYGGEDTDFGQRIGEAGGTLLWVGGAAAYHQHHPAPDPPLQHLEAIVANANRFHRRWGWFPMQGWLDKFAELGLAELDEAGPDRTGPDGQGPEGTGPCWRVSR